MDSKERIAASSRMWSPDNRGRYHRAILRYRSDLTDDERALLATLIPPSPDSLLIEVHRRDGERRHLVFDGKALTLCSPNANVYATVVHPGSVDHVVQ